MTGLAAILRQEHFHLIGDHWQKDDNISYWLHFACLENVMHRSRGVKYNTKIVLSSEHFIFDLHVTQNNNSSEWILKSSKVPIKLSRKIV